VELRDPNGALRHSAVEQEVAVANELCPML
jgi:hypothetical protein